MRRACGGQEGQQGPISGWPKFAAGTGVETFCEAVSEGCHHVHNFDHRERRRLGRPSIEKAPLVQTVGTTIHVSDIFFNHPEARDPTFKIIAFDRYDLENRDMAGLDPNPRSPRTVKGDDLHEWVVVVVTRLRQHISKRTN
jgi:hypothetical protein